MKTCIARSALVAMCIAAVAATAKANGYKVLNMKSAKASAMGEAFIVQADDPSAIAFNPAGLARLRDTRVSMHSLVCNGYTRRTAPDGTEASNMSKWQMVPALYVTSDLGMEDMGFGIGVSAPNGLSSEWAENGFSRYVTTYSSLEVADISPAIGWKVSDGLLAGIGLDCYVSRATLEKMTDLDPGAAALDARTSLNGKGTGWGFNAGIIYEPCPKHGFALTYRHGYSIAYDGSLAIPAAGLDADVTARVEFPPVAVAGYAYRPTDRLKLEINLDWTGWRSVGDIEIASRSPALPDSSQAQKLRNTTAWKIGAEYRISDSTSFRCGYIYNPDATEEETWRPNLPDTDTHFFLLGAGYESGRWTFDAALQAIYYETRTIDNNVDGNETAGSSSVDGTYRTWAPCLSVAGTRKF